jgi:hypothetical protein
MNRESGRAQRQRRLTALVDLWQEEGMSLDEMLAVVDEVIDERMTGLPEDLER